MLMAFDGIVTRNIVQELKTLLLDGKISKISQPSKYDLLLTIYNKKNFFLLISASNNVPRIHLTSGKKENPLVPPDFCMVLRKHLIGGTIESIEQMDLDRVIRFRIKSYDEMGYPAVKFLYVEIMGKHSNIILTNSSDNIIDSIKRVNAAMSRVRLILPGLTYRVLPSDKHSVLENTPALQSIHENIPGNTKVYKLFYTFYTGLSPIIGKEISYNADIDVDRAYSSLDENEREKLNTSFMDQVALIRSNQFNPMIYNSSKGNLLEYYSLELKHLGYYHTKFALMNEAIDYYFSQTDNDDRFHQQIGELQKVIQAKIFKLGKKRENMVADLESESLIDTYKIYGDLLASNIPSITKGMKSIDLPNIYAADQALTSIPLDERKSPWDNVQSYYKKSSKLKTAHKLLMKQLPLIDEEMNYLYQVMDSLDHITDLTELSEIKEELYKENILKKPKSTKKPSPKLKSTKPHHYLLGDGIHIYVGKNNTQNDHLTLKMANKDDYFFHVRNNPGSHVILRTTKALSKEAIEAAAYLAAIHSKVKDEILVDVDYTLKKNVYKQKLAKPGMVYYDHFKTITINTTTKPDALKKV